MIGFFKFINNLVWGFPMIITLLGLHIFFSFKLKFIQKYVLKGIKYTFSAPSAFSSIATMLAATLGTGNIIGVSSAILLGGPGAVFWCWITGVLGMATSYAECFLGIKYRQSTVTGTYNGGPMYVLDKGLNNRFLAVLFCICTLLASFGVGCTTQSAAIKDSCISLAHFFNINHSNNNLNISIYIGIITALIVGTVIIGGIKKISNFCTTLVPIMAIFYLSCCIVLLIINHTYIIDSIKLIIISAFSKQSIIGGFSGYTVSKAIRYGISRGLFTNEAGLGSAPIVAAQSDTYPIHEQSLISMTAVFWDTVVMCALTGIVIVCSILNPSVYDCITKDTNLIELSFKQIPYIGSVFLSIALILFAFATLVGWSFFGEKAFSFLFGHKYMNIFKTIYIVMIFIGATLPMSSVWEMCDFFNALMLVPNAIALFLLRNEIN